MTTNLAFTVFRFTFLILLWPFVLGVMHTLHRDIFGTVVTPRGKGRKEADQRRRNSRKRRHQEPGVSEAPHHILLTGGPLVGTMLPLSGAPVVIGRSPTCTLVLEDEYASGRHARLQPSERGQQVEDLGSRNGTYVDDERLVEPRLLIAGDVIRIGQATLELVK